MMAICKQFDDLISSKSVPNLYIYHDVLPGAHSKYVFTPDTNVSLLAVLAPPNGWEVRDSIAPQST